MLFAVTELKHDVVADVKRLSPTSEARPHE
jgi:hypothetical protein